ncbi:hypothetical protein FF1_019534 [Malus domestica]
MATAVIIAGTDGVDVKTKCMGSHVVLMPSKDTKMKEQLESCEEIGEKVFRDFIEVEDDKRKDLVALQLNIEKFIRSNGESALCHGPHVKNKENAQDIIYLSP